MLRESTKYYSADDMVARKPTALQKSLDPVFAERIETIAVKYSSDMHRVAYSLLGTTQDAQDAVQNALLKMVEYPLTTLPKDKDTEGERSHIMGVVSHAAIDMLKYDHGQKRDTRKTVSIDAYPEALKGYSDPADELALVRMELEQAYMRLKRRFPPYAWYLALGYTTKWMAEKSGIPEGTIKTAIRRWRQQNPRADLLGSLT